MIVRLHSYTAIALSSKHTCVFDELIRVAVPVCETPKTVNTSRDARGAISVEKSKFNINIALIE